MRVALERAMQRNAGSLTPKPAAPGPGRSQSKEQQEKYQAFIDLVERVAGNDRNHPNPISVGSIALDPDNVKWQDVLRDYPENMTSYKERRLNREFEEFKKTGELTPFTDSLRRYGLHTPTDVDWQLIKQLYPQTGT